MRAMSRSIPFSEVHPSHALSACLLARVCSEFNEMPGLRLTPVQAARFLGLGVDQAHDLLRALVEGRFLTLHPDGTYARWQQ